MPSFNNMKDLEKYIKKQTNDSLKKEVQKEIKLEMSRQIHEEVYDTYNSATTDINRRGDLGGLSDIRNMKEYIVGNTLEVVNETTGLNDDFMIAGLVSYGDGWNGLHYTYPYTNRDESVYIFLKPRNFLESTQEEVNKRGTSYLRNALKKRGLDVI